MAKKTGTVKKKVVKVGAVGMAYVHSKTVEKEERA